MRRDLLRVGLAALGGVVGLANGEDEIKLYAWVRGEARPTTATQSYNDGEDIDITADNTVTIIQVIADNPLLHSIGHITIRSDRGPNNQLRLLIAGSDETDLRDSVVTPISEGCLHWAGVHALDIGDPETTPGEATDTGRSLIVAAAINGNFQQVGSATTTPIPTAPAPRTTTKTGASTGAMSPCSSSRRRAEKPTPTAMAAPTAAKSRPSSWRGRPATAETISENAHTRAILVGRNSTPGPSSRSQNQREGGRFSPTLQTHPPYTPPTAGEMAERLKATVC